MKSIGYTLLLATFLLSSLSVQAESPSGAKCIKHLNPIFSVYRNDELADAMNKSSELKGYRTMKLSNVINRTPEANSNKALIQSYQSTLKSTIDPKNCDKYCKNVPVNLEKAKAVAERLGRDTGEFNKPRFFRCDQLGNGSLDLLLQFVVALDMGETNEEPKVETVEEPTPVVADGTPTVEETTPPEDNDPERGAPPYKTYRELVMEYRAAKAAKEPQVLPVEEEEEPAVFY